MTVQKGIIRLLRRKVKGKGEFEYLCWRGDWGYGEGGGCGKGAKIRLPLCAFCSDKNPASTKAARIA